MDFLETPQGVLRIREPSITALKNTLSVLAESPPKRHALGQSNRDFAFSKFDLNATREAFHNLIVQTSQETFREFKFAKRRKVHQPIIQYFSQNRHFKRGIRLLKRGFSAKK